MRRDDDRPTRHAPGGFTLAELLVALVLLAVGVLALAGTVGETLRAGARADIDARAAAALAARVETLASAPCADSAGTGVSRGLAERWRTFARDSVQWLADTVRWRVPGDSARRIGLLVPIRCRP